MFYDFLAINHSAVDLLRAMSGCQKRIPLRARNPPETPCCNSQIFGETFSAY